MGGLDDSTKLHGTLVEGVVTKENAVDCDELDVVVCMGVVTVAPFCASGAGSRTGGVVDVAG